MAPSAPKMTHSRHLSAISSLGSPATPPSRYVLAHEHTPPPVSSLPDDDDEPASHRGSPESSATFNGNRSIASSDDEGTSHHDVEGEDAPSSSSMGSYNSDSVLEVLDNDDEDDEDVLDDEEETAGLDPGEPLVNKGRRRRRRAWNEDESSTESSLIELVPPLLLAHPLPLLPLLAQLPYNFLPAGVVFFIPIICVLTLLSVAAHIVIVYLAWYLKVPTFEDVFATITGRYGRYGVWGGRAFVIVSVIGILVGWLETLYPLMEPAISSYLPRNGFWSSRTLWTIGISAFLLPSLLPSRMTRSLRRAPIILALCLPIAAFLVIGRTVEIEKALVEQHRSEGEETSDIFEEAVGHLARRKFGLAGGSSAGAGLTTLTIFLSPHINTLPIHAALARNKRSSFPIPCLGSSLLLLALSLPLALVPYYLLPALSEEPTLTTPTTPSGVFARLPDDDGWINVARLLMCSVALGSCNMWILRGRDSILKAMGVERGERQKAGKWIGMAIWASVVFLASIGGIVAEKVELIGVLATLAISWLLPAVFFIVTFHVRSPLSIIFPSKAAARAAAQAAAEADADGGPTLRSSRQTESHLDSVQEPATDILLARKERQLQKKRFDRRLWQDLVVYIGILPVGCVTMAWTLGSIIGIW